MSGSVRIVGATAVIGRGASTGATDVDDVRVDVDLGRIVTAEAEGAAAGPSTQIVDARGCVITPGLINAHHHLMQSAFRTVPGTRFAPMREWLTVMARAYRSVGVDGRLTAAAGRVGIAESLLSGVTTVADHHLSWPADADPVQIAEGTVTAARELGARLVFVRGTAGDEPMAAAESVHALHERFIAIPGDRSADAMVQLAVGPSGVHADGPETFAALGKVAAALGLRRRTQANEQVDVAIAAERYGRRPIDLLDEWGWLAPDVTLAHLCDVTGPEIGRIAGSGVTATHAPGCDVPMGWGVAPVRDLLAAGVRVGLGTSGGGSNDAGHLMADARLAMQVSGLIGAPVGAEDLLAAMTAGAAFGLGREDLGRLDPGAAADLCIWDVADVFDAGVADPVAGMLWANPGRRPRDVMVGGRWVVRDGRLLTADPRALARDLAGFLDASAGRR